MKKLQNKIFKFIFSKQLCIDIVETSKNRTFEDDYTIYIKFNNSRKLIWNDSLYFGILVTLGEGYRIKELGNNTLKFEEERLTEIIYKKQILENDYSWTKEISAIASNSKYSLVLSQFNGDYYIEFASYTIGKKQGYNLLFREKIDKRILKEINVEYIRMREFAIENIKKLIPPIVIQLNKVFSTDDLDF